MSKLNLSNRHNLHKSALSRQSAAATCRACRVSSRGRAAARTPGGWETILADPPWRFDPRSRKTGRGRSADQHYQIMSLDELVAMGEAVRRVAARNAVLVLWTTWSILAEGHAHAVMNAWGMPAKSGLPWIKCRPDGSPRMGNGYYFRSCSEPILIGKRGTLPPRLDKGVVGLLESDLDTVAPRTLPQASRAVRAARPPLRDEPPAPRAVQQRGPPWLDGLGPGGGEVLRPLAPLLPGVPVTLPLPLDADQTAAGLPRRPAVVL